MSLLARPTKKRKTTVKLSEAPPGDYTGFKSTDNPPKCYLSNFFGGAEFIYMAFRFEHLRRTRVAALFQELGKVDWDNDNDYDRFKEYRSRLHPGSKQTNAYLKDGKVGAGVLAKLINGCFRKSMKKRLAVVNTIADEMGVPGAPMSREDFFIEEDAALADQKKEWMRRAHSVKFAKPFYFALLRDAHPGWLFERKNGRRDANSNWVGKDGWMAQVLKQTKDWVDSEGAGAGAGGAGASKSEELLRF